jgi:spectrin beta
MAHLQLEKAFQKQLESEVAARQAEKERVERARLEERKRKEVQRITEERKREEERRRYIESPRHLSRDEMNGSLDDHESSMNRYLFAYHVSLQFHRDNN